MWLLMLVEIIDYAQLEKHYAPCQVLNKQLMHDHIDAEW